MNMQILVKLVGLVFRAFIALVFLVALFAAWLFLKPMRYHDLVSAVSADTSYDRALRRLDALRALDTPDIDSLAQTILLTHGRRVSRVVVFYHGITNCPNQFRALGKQFYDLGYNVLIPRQPHHGLKDKMTDDLKNLTAEELTRFTDETLDIAGGLGEEITVAGLSAGGVMAAWAAAHRSDVRRAVVIAPILCSKLVRDDFAKPAASLLLTLPNQFIWWREDEKENLKGTALVYPRFSTHAMGEVLRLSLSVLSYAESRAPVAGSIVMITNENDAAINNETCDRLVELWRQRGAATVQTYRFPASDSLSHDLIDPGQPSQRTAVSYPTLIRLINGVSMSALAQ
jgi:esterase/lipase